MIEKFIKVKNFSVEEINILEDLYKTFLLEDTKKVAEVKTIQEAKKLLTIREMNESRIIEDNRLSVGSILVEISSDKIVGENVELSTKIIDAMSEEYVRDLMVNSPSFLTLLEKSDMNSFLTIYSNYKDIK